MTAKRHRVIMIYHPEWDTPGPAGVKAAAAFASEIAQGKEAVLKAHPGQVTNEARAYMAALRFHVTTVDPAILK